VSREGTPEVVQALFGIAFVVGVLVIVFSLMARTGWDTLAERYRATEPHRGAWRPYPTAVMSRVSIQDPDFRSQQMRFIGGTLRVAASPDALHLRMLFAVIPIVGRLFPEVRIPWSAVTSARRYEAPGWYAPQRDPGTLAQAAYDPNFTGPFVELTVGDPPIFLQMPTDLLGADAMSRLPAQ
ncbi:MAG: hypothetical protein AAB295_04480, partial [Chloroflexota bacterium]